MCFIAWVSVFLFCFVHALFAQEWEWVNPLPQGNTLYDIKIFDADNTIAVGDAGTIMRTRDGGETWDIAYKVTGISRSLRGLSFYGQKGVAVGDSGTVIVSYDGGLTWGRRESGTHDRLFSVFMLDDSLAVAVGDHGIILRTVDGGRSWQPRENKVTNTILSAVTFVDSFGVAVGFNGGQILFSHDMGRTWSKQEHPTFRNFFDVFFLSKTYGFVTSNSGQFFLTENGGATWTEQQLDSKETLFDIHFYDSGKGIIASGPDLFMTNDSGKTWVKVLSHVESALYGLDVVDDGAGIAVGLGGTITTKSDDTENWTPRSQGLTWSLKGLAFVNADTGIAVASNNLVYTFDGGKTWAPIADTIICCLNAIDFFDGKHGTAVGEIGQVLRTDDGGKTWREQTTPLPGTSWRDVFQVTPDTAFIVGAHHVLATADGGVHWVEQESGVPPGDDLNAVFFADSKDGIAVSDNGLVLRTINAGDKWLVEDRSLEPLEDVYFTDANHGVIVGGNGFILYTQDRGQSWIQVSSGIENWLSSLAFVNENIGFAVGQRGTILRTDDGGLSWVSEPTNAAEWLHKVVVREGNNIFAAGANGTILKRVDGVVSVRDIPGATETKPSFILLQNYPNPFNASTTVSFDLPAAGTVTIKVFDVTGKQVTTVYSGHLSDGRHAINWHGDGLATGVYFLQLEFQALNSPRKMMVTRKTLLLK